VSLENASHDFVMIFLDAAAARRWFVESKFGSCPFKLVPAKSAFHVDDVVNDVLDPIAVKLISWDILDRFSPSHHHTFENAWRFHTHRINYQHILAPTFTDLVFSSR